MIDNVKLESAANDIREERAPNGAQQSIKSIKPLKGKQKLFVQNYVNFGHKSYHNGSESLRLAGFRAKDPANYAHKLLKKTQITREIARIEAETANRYTVTKEHAINECRRNYEEASQPQMRKYWYDKWISLIGWDVQRQEVTSIISDDQIVKKFEEWARLRRNISRQSTALGSNRVDNLLESVPNVP